MLQKNMTPEAELQGQHLSKNVLESESESSSSSIPNSPNRPTSMVIKKVNTVIPAHLIAEAISTLHGRDLRWSVPITPSEMQYVQQYVFAKYPEYSNGLVEPAPNPDLYSNEESDEKQNKSPRIIRADSNSNNPSDMSKIHLHPSKLLDLLAKKSSFEGNFISIPEIQARNRALQNCGVTEEDYLVIFSQTAKEAMMMVGEAYPFFRGNYYMTVIREEEEDVIREFVTMKDSKVVAAPEAWLDLRIKGSQLSQYFRRKCKHSPKGLFAYPAYTNGVRSSMHWISEAHRNSWHVLLDASGVDAAGEDRLALALHRPDFVLCKVDVMRAQTDKITCLLVRKNSFETAAVPSA